MFFHTGSGSPRVAGNGSITLGEVNAMTKQRFTEAFPDLGAEDETGQVLAVDHVALSHLYAADHNDVL